MLQFKICFMKKMMQILAFVVILATNATAQNLINGEVDSTFGTNGIVQLDINGNNQREYADATLTGLDGKYYVAGTYGDIGNFQMFITRFSRTGVLDSAYGYNGTVLVNPLISNIAYLNAITLQPDGKLVGAGFATGNDREQILLRLNTDGTLDTSFNHSGILVTGNAGADDVWNDLLVQHDGKIVAVGSINTSGSNQVIGRFNTDGTIDAAFGIAGMAEFDESNTDQFLQIVAYGNDSYLLNTYVNNSTELTIIDNTGHRVSSFGVNGRKAIKPFPNKGVHIGRIRATPDGKIWIAGFAAQNNLYDSFFARLLPNGDYDSTFSDDGIFLEDMASGYWDVFTDFEIQPDGQVFLVGSFEDVPGKKDYWSMMINELGYVNTSYGYLGANIYPLAWGASNASLSRDTEGQLWFAGNVNDSVFFDMALVRLKTSYTSVGIVDQANNGFEASVNVYPNPMAANGTIELQLYSSNNISIHLMDLTGRVAVSLVEQDDLSAGSYLFSLGDLQMPNGMYLVEVVIGNKRVVRKLMLEK